MSKANNPTINAEAVNALRDLQKRKDSGEALDPDSNKALSALSIANRVISSISSGTQVDPAFLKAIILELEKDGGNPRQAQKKITKKKKLKLKKKD